jgi:thioredoxin-like negative regulator of GroEL
MTTFVGCSFHAFPAKLEKESPPTLKSEIMDLKFTTIQVDATVALRAHKLYKTGEYAQAITVLTDILDSEPQNWHARLYLGASYFKTGQPMAAARALRYVYEKTSDPLLKQKACLALQVVQAAINEKSNRLAPECGEYDKFKSNLQPIEIIVQ